jgi:hypothetical protein
MRPGQKSLPITEARLRILVCDVYPDDKVPDFLLPRLVNRAEKMVRKHRLNGVFVADAVLRTEREDVESAVRMYG